MSPITSEEEDDEPQQPEPQPSAYQPEAGVNQLESFISTIAQSSGVNTENIQKLYTVI